MARTPAPPRTRICRVVRNKTLPAPEARTLFFTIHGLGRKMRFAQPGEIPHFEGDEAHFEVQQKNKTKLGHVFLREVEHPGRRIGWT